MLQTMKDAKLLKFRRTKIVATLGPASATPDKIRALIEAGVDVFRLNFSHGDHASHQQTHGFIRAIADEINRPIAILADLCGPKIRVGQFQSGSIELKKDQEVVVTVREVMGKDGLIPSQYAGLIGDLRVGQRLLLSDGLIGLSVLEVGDTDVRCRVLHGGRLSDKKGINLPDSEVSAAALTDKDRRDAALALELGVDYMALSFVRRAADIEELRSLLGERGARIGIVAKMERPESLVEAEAIARAADVLMVARGDLGVELPPEQVPIAQQHLIDVARRHQRPVIVATQMLESMMNNARPTRAEVSDVATAVTGGADAVMLSGETAAGKHPIKAVQMMDRVARQLESHLFHRNKFASLRLGQAEGADYSFFDGLAKATAILSRDLSVRAIVAVSNSGLSAVTMTAARPSAPVIVLSEDDTTRRRMKLAWGVIACRSETDAAAQKARLVAQELGVAEPGQTIMLVRGFNADPQLNMPSVTLLTV